MLLSRTTLAGALLLVSSSIASAQTRAASTTPAPIVAATRADTIASMKAALRNLITYQEKYWSEHATYTTDGVALGTYPVTAGQPMVQVIFAGSRGWTGIATMRGLKGKSCVVYVGNVSELPKLPATMEQAIPAIAEGSPVCDPM